MRSNTTTIKKVTGVIVVIVSFLLDLSNSQAQQDCKRKLDDYNRRLNFPAESLPEYESCLNVLENKYFNATLTNEQKSIRDNLTKDSLKNQIELSRVKQQNITDSINYYTRIGTDINKRIENFNREINRELSRQRDLYKPTLKESYKKIMDYYNSIDGTEKANIYSDKLEQINSGR